MIPAADALMRCPELRWKHCQGTLYRHTEWVVQDSKEWLRKVAVAMQGVSCSKNIVWLLVSKNCLEQPPRVSAPATICNAWACRHHFSLCNGLLNLDLQKQDPKQHKDKLHWIYILTPLRNRIHWKAHDCALGRHFRATKTYMAMRQWIFWPEMWRGVQDSTNGCDMCLQIIQWAGNVAGLLKPLPVAWGHLECVWVDLNAAVPTSLRENNCIETFADHFS